MTLRSVYQYYRLEACGADQTVWATERMDALTSDFIVGLLLAGTDVDEVKKPAALGETLRKQTHGCTGFHQSLSLACALQSFEVGVSAYHDLGAISVDVQMVLHVSADLNQQGVRGIPTSVDVPVQELRLKLPRQATMSEDPRRGLIVRSLTM